MTATMSKPSLESTIEGLVRLHWSNQASILAASKAEVAISYWQRAIREGIAAILFQHRGDSLPRFNTIPLIYESDVHAVLRKHEKDFVHGTPAEKNIALDVIYAELIEFAVPQDLLETDEQERRRLVLEGEEPALPSDAKWIGELAEAKRQEIEALIGLLQPVGKRPRTQPKCDSTGCPIRLGEFDTKQAYIEHLRKDHDYTENAANQFGSAGWSRRVTWMQSLPEHGAYGTQSEAALSKVDDD